MEGVESSSSIASPLYDYIFSPCSLIPRYPMFLLNSLSLISFTNRPLISLFVAIGYIRNPISIISILVYKYIEPGNNKIYTRGINSTRYRLLLQYIILAQNKNCLPCPSVSRRKREQQNNSKQPRERRERDLLLPPFPTHYIWTTVLAIPDIRRRQLDINARDMKLSVRNLLSTP